MAEVSVNNLAEIGIRVQLQPIERAGFFAGYARQEVQAGIIQGASGAFGNAATRMEAFVVKGGAFVYGSYPDIDELFPKQAEELDRDKRTAILAQDAAAGPREGDLRADLAARLSSTAVGPRVGESGVRPDPGLRLHGAVRGHHDQAVSHSVARHGPEFEDAMKQFIIRRTGYTLLSLFLLSVTIFFFVRVTGDPATLLVEPGASQADIEAIHKQFGLDRPLIMQYWLFVTSLFQGDLGKSFYYQTPVMELYLDRLPNSLLLAFVAMGLSLLIGIPAGIMASVQVGRFWDGFGKMFTLLGLSLPSFLVGLAADPGVLGLSRAGCRPREPGRRCT